MDRFDFEEDNDNEDNILSNDITEYDNSIWMVYDLNDFINNGRIYILEDTDKCYMCNYYGDELYKDSNINDKLKDMYLYGVYLEIEKETENLNNDIETFTQNDITLLSSIKYKFNINCFSCKDKMLGSSIFNNSIKDFDMFVDDNKILLELDNFILSGGYHVDSQINNNTIFDFCNINYFTKNYNFKLYLRFNNSVSKYKNFIFSESLYNCIYVNDYTRIEKINSDNVINILNQNTSEITIYHSGSIITSCDFIVFVLHHSNYKYDLNDIRIESIQLLSYPDGEIIMEREQDELYYHEFKNLTYVIYPIKYEFDDVSCLKEYFNKPFNSFFSINKYDNDNSQSNHEKYIPVEENKFNYLNSSAIGIKPIEFKPMEFKPIEIKPMEFKPMEFKPIKIKPMEFKPKSNTMPYDIYPQMNKIINTNIDIKLVISNSVDSNDSIKINNIYLDYFTFEYKSLYI